MGLLYDPPPCVAVSEPALHVIEASLGRPSRYDREDPDRRAPIGVHVVADVPSLRTGPLDPADHLLGLAPVRPIHGLEMGQVHGRARALPDLDDLLHGLEKGVPLSSDVGYIDAPVLGQHPTQLDQFPRVGEGTGLEDQPRGHPHRALRQPLGEKTFHPGEFVGSRRTVLRSDHGHPQGPVTDMGGHVDRDAPLGEIMVVLRQGPPRSRDPAEEEVAPLGPKLPRRLRTRNRREPAVAVHLRGDALHHLGPGLGLFVLHHIGVRVDVHEAGGHDQVRRVDDPVRARVPKTSHRGDSVLADSDVAVVPVVSGAVDDAGSFDQKVEHISAISLC